METKRSPTDVVLSPGSSTSSCEDTSSWRDDHGDFVSLMDENGVIGLLDALEIVGVDVGSDHKVPSGLLDEVGDHRSSALSRGKPPGDQIPPPAPGEI